MEELRVGDVTINSIIERDGAWRAPGMMFPAYDAAVGQRHLQELPPFVYDKVKDLLVITYQTFVVRTPRHTILIDTCTGEHKGFPPPYDFPKQPWLDGLQAHGLTFEDIDYVFCTHLHFDHTGWNTRLIDGRWVPTFPNAKYIFHRREYEAWEAEDRKGQERLGAEGGVWRMNCEPIVAAGQALLVEDDFQLDDTITLLPTPGHSFYHCCVEINSKGQRAIVTGDLMHHILQVREPGWTTIFDVDPPKAAETRLKFLSSVADTGTLLLPVHFPSPTVGCVEAKGDQLHYRFIKCGCA
ncbi:MBL fold metallo-hydrolase [Rhodopseudomonas sp. RCAM05734]|uniref:MBL fold metallo-hydrolase n=1 Tax=Rhodopseudomonas sp. RCAM05734 TaxID=3457549 RepID=UPI0040450729